jgi:type I restriction enzyme, S subunit
VSAGKSVRLKYLASIRVSNVDKKTVEGQLPVQLCNYTDVYYNEVITGDLPFMKATATPEQIQEFTLRAGDVLITKDSETPDDIAVAARVDRSAAGVLCGYHLALLRPIDERVDSRYLLWSLNSQNARNQFSAAATGITRFGLRMDSIGDVRLTVHQLNRQRAIAAFLDVEAVRINDLIAKKRYMIDLLAKRLRSEISRALRAVGAREATLGRFVRDIGQGVSPIADQRPPEIEEWGVLKLNAVKFGRYLPDQSKALASDYEPDPALVPQAGDLLVTRSNTPNYVGDACAVLKTAERRMLPDLIYRVRLLPELHPEFAAYALLSAEGRHQLAGSARGTSQSMVKLRGEDIRAVRFPVPAYKEQARVVDWLNALRAATEHLTALLGRQIMLLQAHRRALITAAITGEVPIPGVAA